MTEEEKRILLNCMIYDPQLDRAKGASVESWAEHVDLDLWPANDADWNKDSPGGMTRAEVQAIVNTIKANPGDFKHMMISDVAMRDITPDQLIPGEPDTANMATIVDGKQVTVLFQGTNGKWDWQESDAPLADPSVVQTPAQKQALAYFEDVVRDHPGAEIVTTGHSLGGSLAHYVAIMRPDEVTGAFSYEGPGFNTGFIKNHRAQLDALNADGRLVTYADAMDPVHAFLIPAGKEVFYQPPEFPVGDYFRHHSPSAMLVIGPDGLVSARPKSAEDWRVSLLDDPRTAPLGATVISLGPLLPLAGPLALPLGALGGAVASAPVILNMPGPLSYAAIDLFITHRTQAAVKAVIDLMRGVTQSGAAHLALETGEKVQRSLREAGHVVVDAALAVGRWGSSVASTVKTSASSALDAMKNYLASAGDAIGGAAQAVRSGALAGVAAAGRMAAGAARRLAREITGIRKNFVDWVKRRLSARAVVAPAAVRPAGQTRSFFVGMDVERVERLSGQLRARADDVVRMRAQVAALVAQACACWEGADSRAFQSSWASYSPKLDGATARLAAMADNLAAQARQQRSASAV